MRILVYSDVHANAEALLAVARVAQDQWDESVCLGDVVGYGASPNEAIEWVRKNSTLSVRGNHDRACASGDGLERFQATAGVAARWTQSQLSPESRSWLQGCPRGPIEWHGAGCSHGSALDEDHYVLTDQDAIRVFEANDLRLQWCGHTHVQGGYSLRQGQLHRLKIRWKPVDGDKVCQGILPLEPGEQYLLNPGSVGQPRDGDWRASFAIWDEDAKTVWFYRASYAVAVAQRRILEAGLPPVLAQRLGRGL